MFTIILEHLFKTFIPKGCLQKKSILRDIVTTRGEGVKKDVKCPKSKLKIPFYKGTFSGRMG